MADTSKKAYLRIENTNYVTDIDYVVHQIVKSLQILDIIKRKIKKQELIVQL